MSAEVSPELQDKVTQAAKIMALDPKDLWQYLNILGIENNAEGQALLEAETTCEEDARELMVEGKGWPNQQKSPPKVKVARFKAGWAFLKGKSTPTNRSDDIAKLIENFRPIGQFSDEELLRRYQEDAPTEILEELAKRSHKRSFVVFKAGLNEIDVKASLELLRIARRQETPNTYLVNNQLTRTYRVGEFPMTYVEECPIHSQVILTNDYCEQCENSWSEITTEQRILVRVAKIIDKLPPLIDLSDLISKFKNEPEFLLKIPSIELRHRELKEENKLPTLRRKISQASRKDPLGNSSFIQHKCW